EAEVSRRSAERAQKLTQIGAVATSEYEKRDAEYKSALASINVQQAQIAMIEQKLRRFGMADADIEKIGAHVDKQHPDTPNTLLRSPFNGIVIEAEVAERETVDIEREVQTIAELHTV